MKIVMSASARLDGTSIPTVSLFTDQNPVDPLDASASSRAREQIPNIVRKRLSRQYVEMGQLIEATIDNAGLSAR